MATTSNKLLYNDFQRKINKREILILLGENDLFPDADAVQDENKLHGMNKSFLK